MADVSRVEYNEEPLIDLTNDTVTPMSLRSGFTAHNAAGDPITGVGGPVSGIDDNAGEGDTDKLWSADKTWRSIDEVRELATGGIHNEGAWVGTKSYTKYAAVTFQGSSYMAIKNVPYEPPTIINPYNTNYWLKLAEAGGAENINDEAGYGSTTVTWSADKLKTETDELKVRTNNLEYDVNHLIDDEAGEGDIYKTWSADKTSKLRTLQHDLVNNTFSESCNCNLAIFKCAKSWIDNYEEHLYYLFEGNPNSINRVNGVNSLVTEIKPGTIGTGENEGKYPIDCMSFIMMCLMGIGYEESIFGDGSNKAKYPRADIPFLSDDFVKYIFFYNGHIPNDIKELPFDFYEVPDFTWGRVASWQFAAYLESKGLYHDIEPYNYSALQPGDILFYSDSEDGKNKYKNIHHVAIYVGNRGRFETIVVLESGRIAFKSNLNGVCGYARIPFSETVLPHNIMKSSVSNSVYSNNTFGVKKIFIDRPINNNDIYLIKYAAKFNSESEVNDTATGFGGVIYYQNEPNFFTYTRHDGNVTDSIFNSDKFIDDEMLIVFDKSLYNIESNYKYLLAIKLNENGSQNTRVVEMTVKEIIPILSSENDARAVPYINPIDATNLQNAVDQIRINTCAYFEGPQTIKSYVYVTISNVKVKYFVKITVIGSTFDILLLKEDFTGIRLVYANSTSTYTTYTVGQPATFELFESIIN